MTPRQLCAPLSAPSHLRTRKQWLCFACAARAKLDVVFFALQATISLNATAGKEGADNAVTSIGNVTIALVVATNTPPVIEADAPVIEAVPECGDALCSPGEPRVKNQPDTPGLTCEEDCPLMLGQCDAPGTTDLGDSTQPCGGAGFGLCNLATLECECYKGYAGPACNWCDDGYVRNGAACEVQVRLLQDVDDNPAGPDATAGPGSTSRVRRRAPMHAHVVSFEYTLTLRAAAARIAIAQTNRLQALAPAERPHACRAPPRPSRATAAPRTTRA